MLDVEDWAELRREQFVRGVSIKELARRTGISRNTIRSALRSSTAPRYSRRLPVSKLDPFKDEIHRLLKADAKPTGQRTRELITSLGFDGGKTIVDDYLRQVRPLFDPPRTYVSAHDLSSPPTSRSRPGAESFGDDVVAAAMIDRLVHHAEILALKGDSYRLKDRDLARPPAARNPGNRLTDHPSAPARKPRRTRLRSPVRAPTRHANPPRRPARAERRSGSPI